MALLEQRSKLLSQLIYACTYPCGVNLPNETFAVLSIKGLFPLPLFHMISFFYLVIKKTKTKQKPKHIDVVEAW